MSDWLFDEQRGNSVSRHAVTQRNSSGCSPRQGLCVIKVDLECEARERERATLICTRKQCWTGEWVTVVEKTEENQQRSINRNFCFITYGKGTAGAIDQASPCSIDRLCAINGEEMLITLSGRRVSIIKRE